MDVWSIVRIKYILIVKDAELEIHGEDTASRKPAVRYLLMSDITLLKCKQRQYI